MMEDRIIAKVGEPLILEASIAVQMKYTVTFFAGSIFIISLGH
jgi:hypothetical protein